jgi:hypothetical protein
MGVTWGQTNYFGTDKLFSMTVNGIVDQPEANLKKLEPISGVRCGVSIKRFFEFFRGNGDRRVFEF